MTFITEGAVAAYALGFPLATAVDWSAGSPNAPAELLANK